MTIRVQMFGPLRETHGATVAVDLPAGATVADLRTRFEGRYAVAVNLEYAADDVPLHESDEVALIPPVSGGTSLS